MSNYDYSGKSVLITGAGSGFGREVAMAFARAGADLSLSDIERDPLTKTVREAEALGATVTHWLCDVRKKTDVQDMIQGTIGVLGRIDVAINNAGIEHTNMPLAQCDDEEWGDVMDVNLKGVFYCLKYELLHMIERKQGVILNVASVAGLGGAPNLGPYAASKHGVVGLTRTAAVENARYNIRVNAICPGVTGTPMVQRFLESDPEAVKKIIRGVPMHRIAEVNEIVEGMLWLCSAENSFMTGQAVAFDGGLTAS
ncbi:glucose 1-dehydrogenase [Emcibacter sp.]|uniref:SDR family NAD(P)-dependent oxidoreductase n=1 Tax=Emcibacter sp. TaxID=1979954 RepID=UPI002AA8A765|nr:glucose 1-dehydrogenase [Emcibacter sp.]